MNNRRVLAPLIVGAAIGLIQGCWNAWHETMYRVYMRCGLYTTGVKMLIKNVDLSALIATALFYSFFLIFFAQLKIAGRARRAFLAAAGVGYAILLYRVYDLSHMSRLIIGELGQDVARGLLQEMITTEGYQLAAAVMVVVVGGIVLFRLRRQGSKAPRRWTCAALSGRSCGKSVLGAVKVIERQRAMAPVSMLIVGMLVIVNLAGACAIALNAMALRRSPNIILIAVDTLRSDHVGCYGYGRNTTPNIDKLAQGSFRFSKAISQAPWTTASVSAFMSGRYQRISLAALKSGPVGRVETPLLSEVLQDRGYATAGVIANAMATQCGLDRGYDRYIKLLVERKSNPDVLNGALSSLDGIGKSKVFLFLLFMDVHAPYLLHDGYNYDPGYHGKLRKVIPPTELNGLVQSPDDVEYAKALYDSGIRYTDDYVGRLVEALKKRNLYDDTLIVLLGDHGEEFAEHGRMEHGDTLYDEALSVPLLIKLPGQRKGSLVRGTFPLLDLFPSIMNYIHVDVARLGLQGSAVNFDGLKFVRPTTIYSSTDFGSTQLASLRSDGQNYIHDEISGQDRLFDLTRDPRERHDLAKIYPSQVVVLRKLVEKKDDEINASLSRLPAAPDALPLSEQEKAQMRSMGYLQ